MTQMRKSTFMLLIALIFLQGTTKSCDQFTPTPSPKPILASRVPNQGAPANPQPSQPAQSQSNPEPQALVTQPQPIGTIHPTTLPEVMFLNSDCPTSGFSGLTPNGSHGALDCMYHWVGKFGPNNLELRIMQYNDPARYKLILDGEVTNFLPKEVVSDKEEFGSTTSSHYSDYYLDMIEESDSSYIFLNTYKDRQTIANPEVALCGNGHGVFGVEGKFVVELQMRSCDLANYIGEYRGVMNTLKDAAEAAITRADANKAP
jgi:hypothetical protein